MSTRILRTLAVAAGAGALVLSAAAPAMAADTVTELPGRTTVTSAAGTSVAIPVANQPAGFTCETANVTWTARVPGKQDAILISPVAGTSLCSEGAISLAITSNSASKKKNAVVKFTGVNTMGTPETTDDTKSVMTLVVKVTDRAKPGKGPRS